MRRRPSDTDAFGVSLLDMLACGLGALALLFILGEIGLSGEIEAAEARRDNAQELLDGARGAMDPAKTERMIVEVIEDASRAEFLSEGNAQDLTPLNGVNRLLVFLDTSGSMSRYANRSDIADPKLRERLSAEGSKWGDTLSLLARGVLAVPDGSGQIRFAVVPISTDARDDLALGQPLYPASDGSAWHPRLDIMKVQDALARIVPGGGAAHGPSFEAAGGLLEQADAILIITDGLPNFGPVQGCSINETFIGNARSEETVCFANGELDINACPNFCIAIPTEGWIDPEFQGSQGVRRGRAIRQSS